jgi:hypothetical protein
VIGPLPPGEPFNARINGKQVRLVGDIGTERLLSIRDATARMSGLEPGRYVLQAVPDDLRFEPAVIVLDEPGLTNVGVALVR